MLLLLGRLCVRLLFDSLSQSREKKKKKKKKFFFWVGKGKTTRLFPSPIAMAITITNRRVIYNAVWRAGGRADGQAISAAKGPASADSYSNTASYRRAKGVPPRAVAPAWRMPLVPLPLSQPWPFLTRKNKRKRNKKRKTFDFVLGFGDRTI
jgi:hypothetical protein